MSLARQVFAPATPVLWLPGDEASGDLVNRGSLALTFALQGAVTYRQPGPLPSINAAGAGKFTQATVFLQGDVNYSVAAWFKTTSADATAYYAGSTVANILLGDYSGSSVGRAFGVHNGKLRMSHYHPSPDGWAIIDSVASVNDGAWHLGGATYNATTDALLLYLDGALVTSGSSNPNHALNGFTTIGAGYGGGAASAAQDIFDGSYFGLAAWSSVLAATDFLRIYQAGIRSGVVV